MNTPQQIEAMWNACPLPVRQRLMMIAEQCDKDCSDYPYIPLGDVIEATGDDVQGFIHVAAGALRILIHLPIELIVKAMPGEDYGPEPQIDYSNDKAQK